MKIREVLTTMSLLGFHFLLSMSINSMRHEKGDAVTVPPLFILGLGMDYLHHRFGVKELPKALLAVTSIAIGVSSSFLESRLRLVKLLEESAHVAYNNLQLQEAVVRQLKVGPQGDKFTHLDDPSQLTSSGAKIAAFLQPQIDYVQQAKDIEQRMKELIPMASRSIVRELLQAAEASQPVDTDTLLKQIPAEIARSRAEKSRLTALICLSTHGFHRATFRRAEWCNELWPVSAPLIHRGRSEMQENLKPGIDHYVRDCVFGKLLWPERDMCAAIDTPQRAYDIAEAVAACTSWHGPTKYRLVEANLQAELDRLEELPEKFSWPSRDYQNLIARSIDLILDMIASPEPLQGLLAEQKHEKG